MPADWQWRGAGGGKSTECWREGIILMTQLATAKVLKQPFRLEHGMFIAEITGLSISAIKTRLHRARCALRVLAIQKDVHPRKFEAA
jgi:hypothetical protein